MTLVGLCRDSGSSLCCASSLSNRCIPYHASQCMADYLDTQIAMDWDYNVSMCGSHPDLNITSKYDAFHREPWQKVMYKCVWSSASWRTREEHILLCCCVSIGRAMLECLSRFRAFCCREFERAVCLTTPSHREQGEEKDWSEVLPGVWLTSCSSFPISFFPPPFCKTTQASPLSAQSIVCWIMWSLCGAVEQICLT